MKKKLGKIALLSVLMVMAFTACKGKTKTATGVAQGGSETSAGSAAEGETQTLKWAVWDIALTTYYEPIIKSFEAAHPGVKVEMVDLGSSDYEAVLATELTGSGSDLDVVMVKTTPSYVTLVNKGVLLPLDDYILNEAVDLEPFGGLTEQLKVDDSLYELPFRKDSWLIYYNKDLFDAAGIAYPSNDMTFDEYNDLARQVADPDRGIYGSHYHIWRSTVQLFGLMDGEHTIADGDYAFLKPYYERVLAEQEDMICQDYATLKTSSLHYSGAFSQGNIAMMNMGAWFIPTLINKIETGEYTDINNWGVVKYPHPEGVEAGTTLSAITCVAIPVSAPKKDLSWEFVKFIASQEGAEILAKTGTFPAYSTDDITDILAKMDGFPQDDSSKEALQVLKSYLEVPINEKSSEIDIILNEAHDNIMTGNTTVDEGLAQMSERVQAILK